MRVQLGTHNNGTITVENPNGDNFIDIHETQDSTIFDFTGNAISNVPVIRKVSAAEVGTMIDGTLIQEHHIGKVIYLKEDNSTSLSSTEILSGVSYPTIPDHALSVITEETVILQQPHKFTVDDIERVKISDILNRNPEGFLHVMGSEFINGDAIQASVANGSIHTGFRTVTLRPGASIELREVIDDLSSVFKLFVKSSIGSDAESYTFGDLGVELSNDDGVSYTSVTQNGVEVDLGNGVSTDFVLKFTNNGAAPISLNSWYVLY